MSNIECLNVKDVVEDNGKTIQQNNLEKKHDIDIGTLVEVKYDRSFDDGSCQKIHARLFVMSHDRDCDGTPLYSLSPYKNGFYKDPEITTNIGDTKWVLNNETAIRVLNEYVCNIPEERLTPIKENVVGTLNWDNESESENIAADIKKWNNAHSSVDISNYEEVGLPELEIIETANLVNRIFDEEFRLTKEFETKMEELRYQRDNIVRMVGYYANIGKKGSQNG